MLTAGANLFSVKKVPGTGEAVVFTDDKCYMYKNKELIYESDASSHSNYIGGRTVPGSYTVKKDIFSLPTNLLFNDDKPQTALSARVYALNAGTEVWHARMGHLGFDNMNLMINREMVDGFSLTKSELEATRKNPGSVNHASWPTLNELPLPPAKTPPPPGCCNSFIQI